MRVLPETIPCLHAEVAEKPSLAEKVTLAVLTVFCELETAYKPHAFVGYNVFSVIFHRDPKASTKINIVLLASAVVEPLMVEMIWYLYDFAENLHGVAKSGVAVVKIFWTEQNYASFSSEALTLCEKIGLLSIDILALMPSKTATQWVTFEGLRVLAGFCKGGEKAKKAYNEGDRFGIIEFMQNIVLISIISNKLFTKT